MGLSNTQLYIPATTTSSGTNSGALVVDGGIGCRGTSTMNSVNITNLNATGTCSLVFSGGYHYMRRINAYDGPCIAGYNGGALGHSSTGVDDAHFVAVLRWDNNNNV